VRRLLNYAVTRPELDLHSDFIKSSIPLLRKQPAEFDENDTINLMEIYNSLAKQLKPVTNDSLIVAEKMQDKLYEGDLELSNAQSERVMSRRIKLELRGLTLSLLLFVIFFISLETLNQDLLENVRQVDVVNQELSSIAQKIYDVSGQSAEKNREIAFLNTQKSQLETLKNALFISESELTTQLTMCINKEYLGFYLGFCKKDQHRDMSSSNLSGAMALVHNDAKIFLSLLNNYLIPLILGGLGASAYMVRRTLDDLSSSSYVLSSYHKHVMRLLLGAVLGVLGPLILFTNKEETLGNSFSPMVIALLMGYSIEFAFSLFDSTIERAKEWATSLKNITTQIKLDNSNLKKE
jgi:hypothetical protein